MKKIQVLMGFGLIAFLFGCASLEKASLASGDGRSAVTEVSGLLEKAQLQQADLLAVDEYMQGMEYLERSKKDLAANDNNEDILESAAIAKASFQKALKISATKNAGAARILQARKAAVAAGLRRSESMQEDLTDLDDDLRDETDNFSERLNPKQFSTFQKRYLALEIKAVQFSSLNDAKQAINIASKQDAEDLAPSSLTTALLDLTEAENEVAQSPRNPGIHKRSVEKAQASALLLTNVMDVILNAKGTPEDIALKIVKQGRQLGSLSKKAGQLEENLMQTEGALKKQSAALKHSSTQVRFQNAMEEARQQFSEADASVYQQGNKLIFRLKKINFSSGKALVPSASRPLLAKINDIIKSLDAKVVTVQGHSDSVGASKFNQTLSTKRARAVSDHLSSLRGGYKTESVGYGESKPIASNETKEGRAINRRVDLVVSAKK